MRTPSGADFTARSRSNNGRARRSGVARHVAVPGGAAGVAPLPSLPDWRATPCKLAAKTDQNGYGRYREAFRRERGPIPAGAHLDHLCETRACENAWHLDPVTCRVNLLRSARTIAHKHANATHCPQGHGYTPENTKWNRQPRGTWSRECRACHRAADRARYWAQKARAS